LQSVEGLPIRTARENVTLERILDGQEHDVQRSGETAMLKAVVEHRDLGAVGPGTPRSLQAIPSRKNLEIRSPALVEKRFVAAVAPQQDRRTDAMGGKRAGDP
jgi:hypothetical protein